MERSNNWNEQKQVRKVESEAEGNNEGRLIQVVSERKAKRAKEIKKGGLKEGSKASQLSTGCLHQGAPGLNDKVPIKPRWSLLPAAMRSQRWTRSGGSITAT